MQKRKGINIGGNPLNSIAGIIILIVAILGFFFLAKIVLKLLWMIAPVLLIAAVIMDYKVVLGFVTWVIDLFKRNVLMGAGAVLLTVLGFPFVAAFLCGKALLKRNVKRAAKDFEKRRDGEFIDYEEVDNEPLKLPEIEKEEKKDDYEQLFDE